MSSKTCKILKNLALGPDEAQWVDSHCNVIEQELKTIIRKGMAKEKTTTEEK